MDNYKIYIPLTENIHTINRRLLLSNIENGNYIMEDSVELYKEKILLEGEKLIEVEFFPTFEISKKYKIKI